MNRTLLKIELCILVLLSTNCVAQGGGSIGDATGSAPNGPYFGQELPGLTPVVFAPGFISTDQFEFGCTFSPDGKGFYFTRRPDYQGSANRLFGTSLVDGIWSEPALAPFAKDIFEFLPLVSPDGERLYFYSSRPHPALDDASNPYGADGDLWYSAKINGKWGEPQYLSCPANRGFCMTVSFTHDGTVYFSGEHNNQRGVFRCTYNDGVFSEPEYLPQEINSVHSAHPFIAPDESYLIFDSQVTGRGKPELHISFRGVDGSWTKAQNMGPEINATKTEFAGRVSPDGKFLFFHRRVEGNGDIYWVDAKVIENLRSTGSE